jgi:cellulose synthase/poly-beta-1,6-N-acetylglucosamine synthase-like glycosyltransferase
MINVKSSQPLARTYDISVVIPVRNGAKTIEACMEAVLHQTLKPYEVIVVDGHSVDGTDKKAQNFPVVLMYENYHTRSGACRVGIEHSTGQYIAFTDADCIPDKDWLFNLSKELNDGIVGVGGAIKNIGDGFWLDSVNLAYGTFLGSANSIQGGAVKNKGFVRSISGCNSLYRKADLVAVGGFNHKLSGAEDSELNARLNKRGKLLFVPNAVVLHNHGRGLKDFAKQMLRYGRDRGVARKFSLAVAPSLVLLVLLLSLIFTPRILLSAIALYLVIIILTGIIFALRKKNSKYVFSIPLIYVIEHVLYSVGFWKGLVLGR